MGIPHLTVIDADDPGICGAETADGHPCRNAAGPDGRCHLPGHKDHSAADGDLPAPPDHLGTLGRQYWHYHIGRCNRAGVLEIVDLTVIEKASEIAELLRRCWLDVQERGPSVPDKNSSTKTNPALSKYNSLMPDYRQLCKQIDGWVQRGGRDQPADAGESPWSEW